VKEIRDRTLLLRVIGALIDERIESDIRIRRSESEAFAEIAIRPNDSLVGLTRLVDDVDLDLTYNGTDVYVIDPRGGLPDEQVRAEEP
jgi:hypothetical protein